jgi:hypothetical protein
MLLEWVLVDDAGIGFDKMVFDAVVVVVFIVLVKLLFGFWVGTLLTFDDFIFFEFIISFNLTFKNHKNIQIYYNFIMLK